MVADSRGSDGRWKTRMSEDGKWEARTMGV